MKTYLTATYLKVTEHGCMHKLCETVQACLASAVDGESDVNLDEVRELPTAGSIYLALQVQANSAQAAAERAEHVYSSVINMMGPAASSLCRRQTSLSYA